MTNAISLGVYSRAEGRDRRVSEMNKRGYQPSVAPRYGSKTASWLDVSARFDTLPDQKIRAQWPKYAITRKSCGNLSITPKSAANEQQIEAQQIAADNDKQASIADQPPATYNARPPEPRRFYYSGPGVAQPKDDPPASVL
jgi:hypothetical protein